jgi:flagellar M-ring protein FliF
MNKNQIYTVGFITAAVVVAAIFWWFLAPAWRPLFTHQISDESSREVSHLLGNQGISYKYRENDSAILVRSEDFAKAQRLLADNGLPKQAGSGLEIFNNSDYGLSEFAQSINYQRGVEEELARTILRMQGIKDARVHLTIKKDSLFEDRKQEPKASVVLDFKDGVTYSPNKVRGVQEIVSAAVPNLRPELVTVVTNQGMILSSSDPSGVTENKSTEDKYKAILDDLLDGFVGQGKYKLAVNVQMDLTKKTTIQEKVLPEGGAGKSGYVLRSKSTSRNDEIPSGRQGIVQTSSDEEFIFSKEKSEIVYPVGAIARVSVGIVIFEELTQDMKASMEDLVFAALSMDKERGDRISIVSTGRLVSPSFDAEPVAAEHPLLDSVQSDARIAGWSIPLITSLIAASVFLLIISLILYLRSRQRRTGALSLAEREILAADIIKWLGAER